MFVDLKWRVFVRIDFGIGSSQGRVGRVVLLDVQRLSRNANLNSIAVPKSPKISDEKKLRIMRTDEPDSTPQKLLRQWEQHIRAHDTRDRSGTVHI